MVVRSKGSRMGTRRKLKKSNRTRGRLIIRAHLQEFNIGDKVLIKMDSAYQKGMPYKRFFGKPGEVLEKRGKSYLVNVRDGGKSKKVLCSSVHLKKA